MHMRLSISHKFSLLHPLAWWGFSFYRSYVRLTSLLLLELLCRHTLLVTRCKNNNHSIMRLGRSSECLGYLRVHGLFQLLVGFWVKLVGVGGIILRRDTFSLDPTSSSTKFAGQEFILFDFNSLIQFCFLFGFCRFHCQDTYKPYGWFEGKYQW